MATRTISTKLQLDGEAEYRASLKNINSELGTLKSELKLTESQFAGHLNSYAALSAKGETLAGMYDQQEKKLAAINKILSEARKKHPGLISVDRSIRGKNENYQTPERGIPETQLDYLGKIVSP